TLPAGCSRSPSWATPAETSPEVEPRAKRHAQVLAPDQAGGQHRVVAGPLADGGDAGGPAHDLDRQLPPGLPAPQQQRGELGRATGTVGPHLLGQAVEAGAVIVPDDGRRLVHEAMTGQDGPGEDVEVLAATAGGAGPEGLVEAVQFLEPAPRDREVRAHPEDAGRVRVQGRVVAVLGQVVDLR